MNIIFNLIFLIIGFIACFCILLLITYICGKINNKENEDICSLADKNMKENKTFEKEEKE